MEFLLNRWHSSWNQGIDQLRARCNNRSSVWSTECEEWGVDIMRTENRPKLGAEIPVWQFTCISYLYWAAYIWVRLMCDIWWYWWQELAEAGRCNIKSEDSTCWSPWVAWLSCLTCPLQVNFQHLHLQFYIQDVSLFPSCGIFHEYNLNIPW